MPLSPASFFNNSVSVAQNYVLTANTAKNFVLQGLSQPYDLGTHPLYIFELEDKTAKNVVVKTFVNLVNRNPNDYQTTEVLIKVNKEEYLAHVAGTISDAIEVRAAIAPSAANVVIAM
jgi:hypothetical protein